MRRGVFGAVVMAALVFAACKKEDPARVAQPGETVAERPGPGGPAAEPAKPADSGGAAAKPSETAWVARAGEIVADEREYLAYARMAWPEGTKGKSLDERRGLAQRLVMRKAAAADAAQRGLGSDPAAIQAELEWKYKTYPALYWAETVEKEVRIDDKELRAILKPQAQHLLGAMVFGSDAEGESRARSVRAQLEAGGDFQALAREQSEGFLAAKSGDMGWVTIPNFMVEAKEAAVIAATKPGANTDPLLTRLGWTIFRVRERMDADKVFAAQKEQELPGLLQQRIEEAKVRRMAELRKSASIHYPAEMPGAPAGAPAAVVSGYVFPAEATPGDEPHGGVTRSVTPAKQRLETTIDAFLLVLEAERIGIAERPEIKLNLALRRMDALAQLQFRSGHASVSVTEAELRDEYKKYYTPDTYEFQVIVVDSRERAADALRRSRGGEDFSALAEEYNTGRQAKSKGMVPLGSPSAHPASIQAALPLLADGEVSEVLDLGGGKWGLIKRLSQQIFLPPPFEEVSGKIRRRLEMQKRGDQTLGMAEEYSKKLKISYNESLLARL